MTMQAMYDRLVEAGFTVDKRYDTLSKGYQFTISKDDRYTSALFEYPADTSKAYCDQKQREFIDFIINKWHNDHAGTQAAPTGTNYEFLGWGLSASVKQEKKLILVGMLGKREAVSFMNIVFDSLKANSVDIVYYNPIRVRFETNHTEVRFVFPVADRIDGISGIRADAIFGQPFTELLMHAKDDAVIAYRDGIGLVDYICQIEREASESVRCAELSKAFTEGLQKGIEDSSAIRAMTRVIMNSLYGKYPEKIYITTGRYNGKTAFRHAFESYLMDKYPNIQLELYAALMKGENNMPTREEVSYIRNDVENTARLVAAMRGVQDRNNRRKLPGIKTVHFSGPVTAVIWEDKTKTIVRCKEGEVPDYEKGFAMAIAKKALGTNKSGSNYYDIFKKYLPKPEVEEETAVEETVENVVEEVTNDG